MTISPERLPLVALQVLKERDLYFSAIAINLTLEEQEKAATMEVNEAFQIVIQELTQNVHDPDPTDIFDILMTLGIERTLAKTVFTIFSNQAADE